MKSVQQNPIPSTKQRRGIALLTVVSMLALATVLVLALFATTRMEFKATNAYADGAWARLYADSVINLVIGQIQRASQQDSSTSGQEIWSSQPGMVRQYRQDGTLLRGNKLYSDSKMTATTEAEIAADTPAADWDKRPAQYVDMNEPVARYDANAGSSKTRLFFPIIDPRAYTLEANKSVEGFNYTTSTNGTSGAALDGVVLPTGGDGNTQRLPMPVEWLYMLKDGTLGSLDNANTFVGAGGAKATKDNPIVSRVAFWTDDESSKININTSGEGTYWDTPRLFHDRDGEWARFQPMTYEYQRYPGHPATTCMSTVLFPNVDMNPLVGDSANPSAAFKKALNYKEAIYDLMPKILPGGSKAGSVQVPAGRKFTPTDFKEVQKALGERLFASVDEFLLRDKFDGSGKRPEFDLGSTDMWAGLSRPEILERIRPFLTPRSRSSETNPFGLPKISMWPEHRVNSVDYRTVFDQTIAYCSSLAGKDYYFTRQDCTSQSELAQIPRNKQLFDYLMALTDMPIPGFGAANATFHTKYGDNRQQILVEIFDYIRSTNLYDENLAMKNVGMDPSIPGLPDSRASAYTATGGLKAKTFTPMRNSTGTSYAGAGQVMPSILPKAKDEIYRGMGRFLTISEAGVHFICCAQGTEHAGGLSAPKLDPAIPPAVTGYTPPRWRGGVWGNSNSWYSNFPPLTGLNRDFHSAYYMNKYPGNDQLEGLGGATADYPGYNPMNWNWCLDKDQPLPPNTKRIQGTIVFEWFCPSTGWSLINPDIQLEVDASQLTVQGRKMFPANGGKILIRPYAHMSNAWGVYMRGGTISYRAFLQGRKLPGVAVGVNGNTKGSLVDDTSYLNYQSKTGVLQNCIQYNLVSDFFDVPADGKIDFGGGLVVVKILPTNTASPQPLQTFNFQFPGSSFPTPNLATKNENTTWGQNFDGSWWVHQPVPAPYWWSYHADGALGRDKDTGKITTTAAADATRMGGRFRFIGNEIGTYGDVPNGGTYNRGNLVIPDDVLQSLVLRHGDPRLTMGQFVVPQTEFQQHRYYGGLNPLNKLMAHNIVLANWSDGPGLDRGDDKKGWRLVKDANYHSSFLPDHPYSFQCGAGLQKYGDFDRGISNQTDGAYINKPDEGNTYGSVNTTTGEQSVPYFTDPWVTWLGGGTYFSPNRQVASPGMLGSLPTGVQEGGGSGTGAKREPWRTLFFRPQTWSQKNNQLPHIGAPKVLKGYGTTGLPIQGIDPPDYLMMDFFWMPVVEPYAISEAASTAGKINLNYQMAPFRHIKRATGLYALLKSETHTAVDFDDANYYLRRPSGAPANKGQTWFAKEDQDTYYDSKNKGRKYWHRKIDADATTKLMDERFGNGFAFISPAQICEVYLLPKKGGSMDLKTPDKWAEKIKDLLNPSNASGILKFWEDHPITAENLKEKPYVDLYPRLTTRSNTYQVHMRVQTIKKARSTDPNKFVVGTDTTGADYRGSAVIERYIDLNDPALQPSKGLDYANSNPTTKPSLETFHRFRIIAQKRFDP